MEAIVEAPIRTTVFTVDRASYCRARLLDVVRQIWKWFALCELLSLIGWWLTNQDDSMHRYAGVILLGLPALVLATMVVVAARIWGPSNRRAFERPRNFEFTSDQITASVGELGNARYSWELITRIARSGDWTLLFQQQLVAAAIPDSCLDPEELPRFQALIQSKQQTRKVRTKL